MADAGRFEIARRPAVNRDPHFIANRFHDERIPFPGFELGGKVRAVRGDFPAGFGLGRRILHHLFQFFILAAVALVHNNNFVEADNGAAKVSVMRAGEFTVVKLNVHPGVAVKLDLHFDNTVLGRKLQPIDRRVRLDD